MKQTIASLVLAFMLFPTLALGETIFELVEREGLYYKKFTTVPFTGKITGNVQGLFKDGKKTRSLGRIPQKRTVKGRGKLQGR